MWYVEANGTGVNGWDSGWDTLRSENKEEPYAGEQIEASAL